MADFTQSIAFEGDFATVDKEAQGVASRLGRTLEGSYGRILARLSNVQNTLGRVSSRLASGITSGLMGVTGGLARGTASLLSVSGALGAGVTAGIGAATTALSGMIDKADALGKVKSLDPTSYQRLALAAEKADASIEDVEKGTITLNRNLAATKLPDTLVTALDKVGLSAEQLRAAKPEQQIHLIADAISKVGDPGEQAALALNLMGESGLKLVPMLREGGQAIKTIGDTAQKQGRIISAEAIASAGALNDSIDAIKEPLAGIATQVVSSIIPRIASGLDGLVAFIDANKTEIMAVIDAVTNGIATAVDIGGRVLSTLVPILEAVWAQGMRVVDAFMAMFGGMEGGQETLDTLLATLSEYLIPAVEGLGDILVWLMEHVLSPAITILTDLWTLLGNLATSLGLVGEGGGMVGDVLSGIASVITGTLGRAIDTLVGGLRTIIGLFNTFTTGTWEDAFMALGNALLDFILQPLRSIVATVISIADAISDDMVPQSIRDFANGGGIQELAREARTPLTPVQVEPPTPVAPTEEWEQYGPERPSPGLAGIGTGKPRSKGGKAGGGAGGKGKGAGGSGGGASDNLIKIAARGIPGLPMAFDPGSVGGMHMPGTPAVPATPNITLQMATPAQVAGQAGDTIIKIEPGAVRIEINGAQVGNTAETRRALTDATTKAVTDAINRATRTLPAGRRT
jgi:hypothetical protein